MVELKLEYMDAMVLKAVVMERLDRERYRTPNKFRQDFVEKLEYYEAQLTKAMEAYNVARFKPQ